MNAIGAQQHVAKETKADQPATSNFLPNGENRARKRNNGGLSKNSYLVRAVGVCDEDGSWITAAGCGGPGWMNKEKVFRVLNGLARKLANKDLEIETFRERQANHDKLIRELLDLTRCHLKLRHAFMEFAKFAMVRFSCREVEAMIEEPLEDLKKQEENKLVGKYFPEEMKLWSYYKVFPSGHKLNSVLNSAVKEALSTGSGDGLPENQPKMPPVADHGPSKEQQPDMIQTPGDGIRQQQTTKVVVKQQLSRSVIQQTVSLQQRPSTSAMQQRQQQQPARTPTAPVKTPAQQGPPTPVQRRSSTPMQPPLPSPNMPPSIPRKRSRSPSRSRTRASINVDSGPRARAPVNMDSGPKIRTPVSVNNEKQPAIKTRAAALALENQQHGRIPMFGKSASANNMAEPSSRAAGGVINCQANAARPGNPGYRMTNLVTPVRQPTPAKPAAVVMGRPVPLPSSVIKGNHAARPNGNVIQNNLQRQNMANSFPQPSTPNFNVQKVENLGVPSNIRFQSNGRSLPSMLSNQCNGFKRQSLGCASGTPQKLSRVEAEDDVIVLSSDEEA